MLLDAEFLTAQSRRKTVFACFAKAIFYLMVACTILIAGSVLEIRHHKNVVENAHKDTECGLVLDGFKDFQVGDSLVCYAVVDEPRSFVPFCSK